MNPRHSEPAQQRIPATIALVTDEIPGIGASGGIGAAMHELAVLLADAGHDVWLYFVGGAHTLSTADRNTVRATYDLLGVRFQHIDPARWTSHGGLPGLSYAIHRELTGTESPNFDWVHFADYHGLGFYFLEACQQGLVEPRPNTVVQLHGTTRWAVDANNALFTTEEQLIADWMEGRCIEAADQLVSPSHYLAEHIAERYPQRHCADIRVIKNAFQSIDDSCQVVGDGTQLNELVFFGRHEPRKGLIHFCDAIDRIHDLLESREATVTFLGSFGTVNDEFSGLYLLDRASRWNLSIKVLPGLSRANALSYLRDADSALVVVPSPRENSPYTVVESLASGRFVVTSSEGGAHELLSTSSQSQFTSAPGGQALAEALRSVLSSPHLNEALAQSVSEIRQEWLELHAQGSMHQSATDTEARDLPLVTVVITHYERPGKLLEAVESVVRQDYPQIEIIIVDDGSAQPTTLDQLNVLRPYFDRVGAKFVRQENGYLSAARNRGLAEARGEFVVFLDDDDIALPTLVSTLVRAQRSTGADVMMALCLFLPESQRGNFLFAPESWKQPVVYLPLGGPRSLALVHNSFGSSTSLIRRSTINAIGGYTELKGVGFEDLETYLAMSASGADIRVVAEPLFLYEVDRPSMISTTPSMLNYKRVLDRAIRDGLSDEFHDLLALLVGRTAHQNGHHQIHHRYHLRRAIPEEFELLSAQVSPERALELLGVVAAHRGLSHLERDLALSAVECARVKNPDFTPTAYFPSSTERSVRDTQAAPDSLELQIHLAEFTRSTITEQSVLDLTNTIKSSDTRSNFVRWIQVIPWVQLHDEMPSACDQLTTATIDYLNRRLSFGLLQGDDLRAAECAAAWLTDRRRRQKMSGTLALGLRAMVLLDSDDYVQQNPDVRDAVQSGHFPDAITHYVLHGRHEGRSGFNRTRGYLAFTVNPDDMPSALASLTNPAPPTNVVGGSAPEAV